MQEQELNRIRAAVRVHGMRRAGKSVKECIEAISRDFDVLATPSAVAGMYMRQREAHAHDKRDLAICSALDKGRTPREIAELFNVTPAHVDALAREIRE